MKEAPIKRAGWRSLLAFEAATLGAGGLTAFLTKDQMPFYDTLKKPVFAPPGWCFPVAWSILYAGMAYAAWRVWKKKQPRRRSAMLLYIVQLAVNIAWPWLFFVMHALGLSFLWLVLLWALVLMMTVLFYSKDHAAGWLLVPYLAWVSFAGALNFAVARLNP